MWGNSSRRIRRWWLVAAGVSAALVCGLLGQQIALAAAWRPPTPTDDTPVPVVPVHPKAMVATGIVKPVLDAGRLGWPAAGTATVDLATTTASTRSAASTLTWVKAGGLPVRVAPPTQAGAAATTAGDSAGVRRVAVSFADRPRTTRARVDGVLLSVRRADGGSENGAVSVQVDYSSFAGAFGGDWAGRLRLVQLPACALTDPTNPDCQAQTPVPTTNDTRASTLTAQVSAGPQPTVYAATAGSAGDNGDYKASTLAPAATWQVSAQSGDFSWTYPLTAPPSLAGPRPQLALSYSSGSVDGRTGATNNQPSWIGDGWEMWPGYVERSYRACADDQAAANGQKPNNATHSSGDLCWATDNATMSLNGRATALVLDASGAWRPKDDDGSRVERIAGDGTRSNGDNDNEYWRITTVDGTQYYFGYNRLPGWVSGRAQTNSAWTEPVFGNHPNEPCHTSTYSTSYCGQAWRWNLDYVVDPHGNTMAYYYKAETGAYARDSKTTQRATYTRGGWLDHIDYGMRSGSEYTTQAPMRVDFAVGNRCLASCYSGSPAKPVATNWPDTPWDQDCPASPCGSSQTAPTFWTTKRLTTITTHVLSGSSYRDVDRWTLREEYLNAGTNEGTPQWLRSITHTGEAASPSVTVPEVTFYPGGNPLANRVDGPSDGRTSLNRWRIQVITNEAGGQTTIGYEPPQCTRSALPSPETNAQRCYPVWWAPTGQTPTLDWFHKYRVAHTVTLDAFSGNAAQDVYYDYLDAPAWHYTTDEMTPDKRRTWGEFHGYSKVRVRSGKAGGTQTQTDYLYLRGMDGDHLSTGTRHVTVTDSQGGTVTDSAQFQGFLREQITVNGVGGKEVTGTLNDPVSRGPTATRTSAWGTVSAYMVHTGQTVTRTDLATGGARTTRTTTTYNNDGLPVRVDDAGDTATTNDDLCIRTSYATSTSRWIRNTVSRVETLSVRCAAATTPATPATVVSDKRTYYDTATTWGSAPTKGDVVQTDELDSFTGNTPSYVVTAHTTYDANGRPLDGYDALNHRTSTRYTPAGGGPVTQVVVTDAKGHATTTVKDPAWNVPVTVTGPNGGRTDVAYDALGHVTAVWQPGRDKAANPTTPSIRYAYVYHNDGKTPTVVTAQVLLPTGTAYRTTTTLMDGQLRGRQVQTQATGGGRSIVDTVYGDRGNLSWKSDPYVDTSAGPGGTLVTSVNQTQIPAYTLHRYDGANRETDTIVMGRGSELWRTRVAYGGDHTDLTPPAGGTPTTTYTDARGRVSELRQYHAAAPTGTFDATRYTYTPAGQPATVTDAAGNSWIYTYDLRGRRIGTVDPDQGTSSAGYDAAGELTQTTDARHVTLRYTYDELGRKKGEYLGSTAPADQLAGWTYDDPAVPHSAGRLTASTRYVGGAGGSAYTTAVTQYDNAGRVLTSSVTLPATEGRLAGTYTTTNTYKPDGSLATTTLPAAGDLAAEKLFYTYTDVGDPATMFSALTNYVYSVTYNKTGHLTQRVLGSVGHQTALTYTYEDTTNRLAAALTSPENQPDAAQYAYTYNPHGDVTAIADTGGGTVDRQCFTRDYLGRLANAWTPSTGSCTGTPSTAALGGPAPYWVSYDAYDVTGNRTNETVHSASGNTVRAYHYPSTGAGQPHTLTSVTSTGAVNRTDSYGYDAAGNTTSRPGQTLNWDAEGHLADLTQSGKTTRYGYDADGTRLVEHDPQGTTAYLPGGLELRLTNGSATPTATRYYSHLGATIAVRTAKALTWLAGDHHGTTTVQVDDATMTVNRQRTMPFGAPRGSAPANWAGTKGFVGGTADPTGLTHLGAREYDPATGRFLSVDPDRDQNDPQQLNGFSYATGDPVSKSDPSGRRPVCGDDDGRPHPCAAGEEGYQPPVPGGGHTQTGDCPLTILSGCHTGPLTPRTGAHPTCDTVWVAGKCLAPNAPQLRAANLRNGSDALAMTSVDSNNCVLHAHQIVCFGVSSLYVPEVGTSFDLETGRAMTIGDVVLWKGDEASFNQKVSDDRNQKNDLAIKYGNAIADQYGRDIERHETVHSEQWTHYSNTSSFFLAYGAQSAKSYRNTGDLALDNDFETGANLYWGSYLTYTPVPGPTPHPSPLGYS